MSRRSDLEKDIQDVYDLIRQNEGRIPTLTDPRERKRCKQQNDELWEEIEEKILEYEKLVPDRRRWHALVSELAVKFLESTIPPVGPRQPSTQALQKTEINVMSWNIAGAKMLKHLDYAPDKATSSYVEAYHNAWTQIVRDLLPKYSGGPKYPDIILLQECIGFRDIRANPSGRWESGKRVLQQIFRGYESFFFPALSSRTHPHPGKWQPFKLGNTRNFIPDNVEAQQGYGICIRDPSMLRKLWIEDEDESQISHHSDWPGSDFELCFEVINATPGLYLGNRDTESRLMVMGRIKMESAEGVERYVNFVNVHLTTLKGEREGIPDINEKAQDIRLNQLDLLTTHVISAYQKIKTHRIPRPKAQSKEDIWILGGDFNATPDSEEIQRIRQIFVEGNDDNRIIDPSGTYRDQVGTKWSLYNSKMQPVVLDYVFCGLKHTSFSSPKQVDITDSQRPFRPRFDESGFAPDHAALFASFKV